VGPAQTLKRLGAEMKRLIVADAVPGEEVGIPISIENGSGVLALLEYMYGNAGESETVRAVGLIDNVVVEYSEILVEAAKVLKLTEAQLQQLRCVPRSIPQNAES